MSQIVYNKVNVYVHDCVDSEEGYVEQCESCESNPAQYKDAHACRCSIVSYCLTCVELYVRAERVRENVARLERVNAPRSAVDLARSDLAKLLVATHS
jgi:hypothetical protein